ncbi:unnamed protein product, partial [Prorocentrum cordatum]
DVANVTAEPTVFGTVRQMKGPPFWMKDLLAEVRGMNAGIAKMEQSMILEIRDFRSALQTHDSNPRSVHTRLTEVERVCQKTVTEAVAAAIDVQLEGIKQEPNELKEPPSSGASFASTRTGPSTVPQPRGGGQAPTNPLVRFAGTFPRPVHQTAREAHCQHLLNANQILLQDVEPIFHKAAQNYKLRQISRVYQPTLGRLKAHPECTCECKRGVNGFKGKVMPVTPRGIYTIVKTAKRSAHVGERVAVQEELNLWNFNADEIQRRFNAAYTAAQLE